MNDRTARRRTAALRAFATMMATETGEDDYPTMSEDILEELALRHFHRQASRMDWNDQFWFWDHVLELCKPWLGAT